MATAQQQARRQQRIEDLCAASLRALTGAHDLHYRGRMLHRGSKRLPVNAPHLRLADDNTDFNAYRGVADAMALRLLYSDSALHRRLCPDEPVARLIFELLEQLRVEARVPAYLPGMAHNLDQRFTAWSGEFHHSGLTAGDAGQLIYAVAQICWARLGNRPVLEETEGLIETLRGELVPTIGGALAGLRRNRDDQAAFAEHALAIACFVAAAIDRQAPASEDESEDAADKASGFALLLDFDDEQSDAIATALTGQSRVFAEARQQYRVFTTEYDQQQDADTVVRVAQLVSFRERLDHDIRQLDVNVRRLSRMFAVALSVPARSDWRFGEEAGRIDGRRLAQLVSSPHEHRIFTHEQDKPRMNCQVSFLIDCSGSMKTHSAFIAMLVDILARALDMAGAATEILGFTTGAWNGGRSGKAWIKAGRPVHPGRLNEARYLVFKAAEYSWRRARRGIGALLRADLYREGIDGEAVDWACARTLGREDRRRILIVISDGCPMDRATAMANDDFYLDNHLKDVVERRQREGKIEIRGLGVGLDLSPYYRQSRVVDPAAGLGNDTLREVAELITGRQHQR